MLPSLFWKSKDSRLIKRKYTDKIHRTQKDKENDFQRIARKCKLMLIRIKQINYQAKIMQAVGSGVTQVNMIQYEKIQKISILEEIVENYISQL